MAENDPIQQVKERGEQGRKFAMSGAQGEPGEKQPDPMSTTASAQETLDQLQKTVEAVQAPTRGPSAGETENHPVPAHERKMPLGPAATQALDQAAGGITSARAALTNQLASDARITADPRYERDQMVYKLGAEGKLAGIAPSEAEAAAGAVRAGITPEVAEKIPKNAEEQVSEDMERLEEAEKKPSSTGVASASGPGAQDQAGAQPEDSGSGGGSAGGTPIR